tara:strand:- start:3767 stop:4693 length:927 start_codon:yes stop_codon:yes gene_type:complete
VIESDHLVKDFGLIRAVDDVTFSVKKGDILGFLGPNGAGKSTTMKMITGFLSPTSGTARVGGFDIHKDPISAKRLFGYLPESGPVYQEMTVLEFLGFIAELRGYRASTEKARRIDRVVQICHLGEVRNQPIETLSKGFRQRVGLAQAVIHDPPYLIMDEPTDGLDPNQKQEVRRLIASMAEEKAIILSTHILEEVQAMCNRVVIITRGAIIVDEKPEEFRQRHPRYNAVQLNIAEGQSSIEIRKELDELPEIEEVHEKNGAILLVPSDGRSIDSLVLRMAQEKNWELKNIEKTPIRLEDVFWNLTHSN